MKICENNDYCRIEMPKEDTFLKYNNGTQSMKATYAIYADTESLLKKWILVVTIQVNHQQKG